MKALIFSANRWKGDYSQILSLWVKKFIIEYQWAKDCWWRLPDSGTSNPYIAVTHQSLRALGQACINSLGLLF